MTFSLQFGSAAKYTLRAGVVAAISASSGFGFGGAASSAENNFVVSSDGMGFGGSALVRSVVSITAVDGFGFGGTAAVTSIQGGGSGGFGLSGFGDAGFGG